MPEKICLRRAAAANLLHEIPAKTCRLVQCQFPYIGIRLVMAELSIPLQLHVFLARSCQFPHNTVANIAYCKSWSGQVIIIIAACKWRERERERLLEHRWLQQTSLFRSMSLSLQKDTCQFFCNTAGNIAGIANAATLVRSCRDWWKSGHTLWKWKWGVCVTHVFQNQ